MNYLFKIIAFGIWPALPLTGYLILPSLIRESKITSLPKFTSFSLITVAGIAFWSVFLLASAVLGVYRADYFGFAGWLITLFASIWLFKNRAVFKQVILKLSNWDILLLLGLSFAIYLYLVFPSENIWCGRDEGVYTNHAIYIANHGRLDVPYPWPEKLDHIFHKGVKEIPGFYTTKPNMTVQFAHLFPVWLSQAFSTFDYHGLFRLNALFALLSLCIFYGLCRCVMPKGYAVVAVLLLAFNPSQLWVARITLTEILTQLFIWAGLLTLLLAQKYENRGLAIWAGIYFGFSAIVRIDSFLLTSLIFLAPVIQKLADEKSWEKLLLIWLFFFIGAMPVFALALAYYAFLSTPYFLALSAQLKLIVILNLVSFFIFLVSVKSKRWEIIRQIIIDKKKLILVFTGILLIVLTTYAYWIRPYIEPFSLIDNPKHFLHGTRDYRENTLLNLSHYLSPPIIILGILGWYITLLEVFQKQRVSYLVPLLVCFAGYSLLYVWNPLISPLHFWLIRRFVPIIIPGFIFFASLGMLYLMDKLPTRYSFTKIAIQVIMAIFLIIFTIKADKLFIFFSENKGQYLKYKEFSEMLPNHLIMARGRPAWIAPLQISFNKNVVYLNFDMKHGAYALYKYSANQLKEKKPVYILLDEAVNLTGLQLLKINEVILSRNFVEQTPYPLPRIIESVEEKIILYKITGIDEIYYEALEDDKKLSDTIAEKLLNHNFGREKVLSIIESGIYGQEFVEEELARWTKRHGKFIIPLSTNMNRLPIAMSMEISSTGGIREKRVKILANGYELFDGVIPQGRWTQIFSLSNVPLVREERLNIELVSDIHVPSQVIKGSHDNRTLGVLIKGIMLLDKIPDYINKNVGSERISYVGESGYHGQEINDDKPFRWTNGHGKLKILIDKNRLPKAMSVEIGPYGGIKEKNITILANGKELYKSKISNAGFSQIFSLSGIPMDDQLVIESLSDIHIPTEMIKTSTDHRKLGVMVKGIKLLDAMPDFINQDIGNRTVFGVGESGFHAQEFISGRPVRWTSGVSKLMVPLDPKRMPKALMVNIEMTGIEKKRLRVRINGRELFHGEIPAGGWSKMFNLSGLPLGKQATIELLSDTHIPKEIIKGSEDNRPLGILVGNIRLVNRLPDYFDVTLGAQKVLAIGEEGFHGQEFIGDMPVRWTDGAAKLEILMDRRRPPKALTVDIESTGGVNEKDSKILINGYALFEGKIPDGGWTQTFDLSGIPLKDRINIELLSDTHIPGEIIQGSPDTRKLGLMVKGVKLLKDYRLE